MLKISSFFLGEDYKLLSTMDHNSKSKVKKLFLYILIPTFMTGLSIFTFTGLMGFSFAVRVIATILSAALIFMVDSSLASAATMANPKLMRNRYAITFCITIFGAIGMDSTMFHSAIEPVARELHHKRLQVTIDEENAKLDARILSLEMSLNDANLKVEKRESQYIGEISGTSGTGQKGVGNVAQKMAELADIARSEQNAIQSKLIAAQSQRDHNASRFEQDMATSGALLHIEAMFLFLMDNPLALILWLPLTLLCILLDFQFLRYKENTKETAYEKHLKEEAERMMESIRVEALLRRGREARMAALSPVARRLSQHFQHLN